MYLNYLRKSRLRSIVRIQIQLILDEYRDGWSGILQIKLNEDGSIKLCCLKRNQMLKMWNNKLGKTLQGNKKSKNCGTYRVAEHIPE